MIFFPRKRLKWKALCSSTQGKLHRQIQLPVFSLSATQQTFFFFFFRLASPTYGFTIMNRLSMENLTEPITKELDFQLQDPFLLYRNARRKSDVACFPRMPN